MGTRFEWDPVKAAINLEKHGIDFGTAVHVFADPFALSDQDRVQADEQRWRTLGMVEGHLLILVAHTLREQDEEGRTIEVIRLISARRADPKEKRRYAQENK